MYLSQLLAPSLRTNQPSPHQFATRDLQIWPLQFFSWNMCIHECSRSIPAFAVAMLYSHSIDIMAPFSFSAFDRHVTATYDSLANVIKAMIRMFNVAVRFGMVAIRTIESLPVVGSYHCLLHNC